MQRKPTGFLFLRCLPLTTKLLITTVYGCQQSWSTKRCPVIPRHASASSHYVTPGLAPHHSQSDTIISFFCDISEKSFLFPSGAKFKKPSANRGWSCGRGMQKFPRWAQIGIFLGNMWKTRVFYWWHQIAVGTNYVYIFQVSIFLLFSYLTCVVYITFPED